MSAKSLRWIVAVFALSRALIVGTGTLALATLPPGNTGPGYRTLPDSPPALDMFYRWDAGFYLGIALDGYAWQRQAEPTPDIVFFPAYPLAIRAVYTGIGCPGGMDREPCAAVAGVIVSNATLLLASFLLFDLVRRRYDAMTARRAVLLLMLSPIGVYLSGIYTESLFLLFTLLAFWCADRDRFLAAALAGCCAVLTRPTGLAVVPGLLWLAWSAHWTRRALMLLPVLIYAAYIAGAGLSTGQMDAYFAINRDFWGREPGRFFAGIIAYFDGRPVAILGEWFAYADPLSFVAWLLLGFALLRRQTAWGLFALAAIAIPAWTGVMISMPRFGLVLFPVYAIVAVWMRHLRPHSRRLIYLISGGLCVLFAARFALWYWTV